MNQQEILIAILVNYTCHPVVMGPENRHVSADWVGEMRARVEKETNCLCLFFQGAAADINPLRSVLAPNQWNAVEEQGRQVADAVMAGCKKAHALQINAINCRQITHWVRLAPPTRLKEYLRWIARRWRNRLTSRSRFQKFPWSVVVERRGNSLYSPIRVGVLKIGDWSLATLETEPFVKTGLAIKDLAPTAMTFVAGYTNGCNSYLPVASAYGVGGYEVDNAPAYYGLPWGFEPDAEQLVREQLLQLYEADSPNPL